MTTRAAAAFGLFAVVVAEIVAVAVGWVATDMSLATGVDGFMVPNAIIAPAVNPAIASTLPHPTPNNSPAAVASTGFGKNTAVPSEQTPTNTAGAAGPAFCTSARSWAPSGMSTRWAVAANTMTSSARRMRPARRISSPYRASWGT